MSRAGLTSETVFHTWDDYYIPGTSVLRNKFTTPEKPYGETDRSVLRILETAATAFRLTEMARRPILSRFDYDHMKAIHRYIFQDVYEWAGKERVGPTGGFMTKSGHAYYDAGPHLSLAANAEYERLASKNLLRGLELQEFVEELAESWSTLNLIHSFREGNTRSQLVFFTRLANQAGYWIDTSKFTLTSPLRDEFVQARFHSQDTGDIDPLVAVLRRVVRPTSR